VTRKERDAATTANRDGAEMNTETTTLNTSYSSTVNGAYQEEALADSAHRMNGFKRDSGEREGSHDKAGAPGGGGGDDSAKPLCACSKDHMIIKSYLPEVLEGHHHHHPSSRFQRAAEPPPLVPGYVGPEHAERLSHLAPEVVSARGYTTVAAGQRRQLAPFGYLDYQQREGLLIPRFPVLLGGNAGGSQLRPTHPRKDRRRKLIKYETPSGQLNCLDAHPLVRHLLRQASTPLFVTEGIIKSDMAVSHGLCCVALTGVWNWRGAEVRGGAPVSLPDWEYLALQGRHVFIVFDADVVTKKSVHDSLARLKPFLERKGALVHIVYLESGDLEDYFRGN
jgi:Domain of unknown function (DUF3854)